MSSATCKVCGKELEPDELQGYTSCEDCKQTLIQQVKEGVLKSY